MYHCNVEVLKPSLSLSETLGAPEQLGFTSGTHRYSSILLSDAAFEQRP